MSNKAMLALAALLFWVLIVGLPRVVTHTRAAESRFGAIAYSFKTEQYGVGAGDTTAEAKKNAMRFCEKRDCEILLEYKEECGSLAISKDGYYGSGVGRNRREAEKAALEYCRQSGNGCQIVITDCTFED